MSIDPTRTEHAPPTWAGLVLARDAALIGRLANLARVPGLMSATQAPFHPGDTLAGASRTVAEALVLFGPTRCADAFRILLPQLPMACTDMDPRRMGRVPTTLGLLGFIVSARNAGQPAGPATDELIDAWADALAERDPPAETHEREAAALHVLALGRDAAARSLLASSSIGAPSVSDAGALCREWLAMLDSNARPESALPVWERFLQDFPARLAAVRVNWFTLQAAARVALARLGTCPADEVAAGLHREVMQAVSRAY